MKLGTAKWCALLVGGLASAGTVRADEPQVPQTGQVWRVPGVSLKLVPVSAGTFRMGSSKSERGRDETESLHQVELSKPFWMSNKEITQEQYRDLTGKVPSKHKGAKLPVSNVSWAEADEFCQKLTEREKQGGRLPKGYIYRLPTEAEWEYCCRSGTESAFHYGNTLSSFQANFNGFQPYGVGIQGVNRKKPVRCGSFTPNKWGLYDMHGNVAEWCHDWFEPYPEEAVTNPLGGEVGKERVVRGGSWDSPFGGGNCRSAARDSMPPNGSRDDLGFRVVLGPKLFSAGSLILECKVDGRLLINGRVLQEVKTGETYTFSNVYPGRHHITVVNPSGEKWQKLVDVKQGTEVKVNIQVGKTFTPQFNTSWTWTVLPVGMKMVPIKPGVFEMGSPPFELHRDRNETLHKVKITKQFWMGIHEVTQGQYTELMKDNPSYFKKLFPDAPVESVSWVNAEAYCEKLTQLEKAAERLPKGYVYRLPTESEWEYCCRAGTVDRFSFNETLSDEQPREYIRYTARGNYHPLPVGSKRPNPWGLYDMHGNVWEWCFDQFGVYDDGLQVDPSGAPAGHLRVIKGGSYSSTLWLCRSATRAQFHPKQTRHDLGFRVVLAPAIGAQESKPEKAPPTTETSP